MKKDWVLRVEGVNLGATIFNTNDLSTIRGSSMVLEVFGYELSKKLAEQNPPVAVEAVYRAAAQSVFQLNGLTEAEALATKTQVRKILQKEYIQGPLDPKFVSPATLEKMGLDVVADEDVPNLAMPSEHMTFVIDLAQIESLSNIPRENLRRAVDIAMMANRRQQLRAPNLPRSPAAIAPTATDAARFGVQCAIDPMQQLGVDPGKSSVWMHEDQFPNAPALQCDGKLRRKHFSKRAADLRKYGRDARQTLYAYTLKSSDREPLIRQDLFTKYVFAESFEDIIAKPRGAVDDIIGTKLAYLYIDGSGFSDLRAKMDIKEFASVLARVNSTVTGQILSHFMTNRSDDDSEIYILIRDYWDWKLNKTVKKNLLRLETIFAGGDDSCIVMPAWLAWEMSAKILIWMADAAKIACQSLSITPPFPMTYRGGLLICPHKTPFRKAISAAGMLCNDAKSAYDPGPAEPALAFHIIEGQDLREAEQGLFGFRGPAYEVQSKQLPNGADPKQVVAAGFRILIKDKPRIDNGISAAKLNLPKSQLHKLITALEADSNGDQNKLFKSFMATYENRGKSPVTADELVAMLPGQPDTPLSLRLKVLADLWDYHEPLAARSARVTA